MSKQLMLPANRAFDSNGLPEAGATASLYLSGGLVPANFYSDSGLTTSLGSTLTANAAGRLAQQAYGDETVAYRLIIKDALGAQLDDIDPFYFGSVVGGPNDYGLSTALAATTGASLVGTSGGTTVEAVLDGVQDDINSALASQFSTEMWRKLDMAAAGVIGTNGPIDLAFLWGPSDSRANSTDEIAYQFISWIASLYPQITFQTRFLQITGDTLSWGAYSTLQTGTGSAICWFDIAAISGANFDTFYGANGDIVFGNTARQFTVTGTTTSGSNSITGVDLSHIKKLQRVNGTGIVSNSKILSTSGTDTIGLNYNATASGTVTLTVTDEPNYDVVFVMQGPNFGYTVDYYSCVSSWLQGLLEVTKRAPRAAIVATFGMPWISKTAYTYQCDAALRHVGRILGIPVLNAIDRVLAISPSTAQDALYSVDGNGDLHPNTSGTALHLSYLKSDLARHEDHGSSQTTRIRGGLPNLIPNGGGYDWDEIASQPKGWILTNCTATRSPGYAESGPYSVLITATNGGPATVEIPIDVAAVRGQYAIAAMRARVVNGADATTGRIYLKQDIVDTTTSAGRVSPRDVDGYRYFAVARNFRKGCNSASLVIFCSDSTNSAGGSQIYIDAVGVFVGGVPEKIADVPSDFFVPNLYDPALVRIPSGGDGTLTVTGSAIVLASATAGVARVAIALPHLKVGRSYRIDWTLDAGNSAGVLYLRTGIAGDGTLVNSATAPHLNAGTYTFVATSPSMCLCPSGATGETGWSITVTRIVEAYRHNAPLRWLLQPTVGSITSAATAPAANNLKLYRFELSEAVRVTDLGVRVLTLSTGGNVAAAIYKEADTARAPTGAPLITSGSLSTGSTGGVSASVTETLLAPGAYWMATNCDNGTAVLFAFSSPLGQVTIGSASLSSVFTTSGYTKASVTYGTWPTLTGNLTTDSITDNTNSNVPVVAWKLS